MLYQTTERAQNLINSEISHHKKRGFEMTYFVIAIGNIIDSQDLNLSLLPSVLNERPLIQTFLINAIQNLL
jgi:hypothetical protein